MLSRHFAEESMEKLRSIEEAAQTLAVSPWTIRAYVRKGKIRPVRIGRRVLIEPSEIVRIIEEGRAGRPEVQGDN